MSSSSQPRRLRKTHSNMVSPLEFRCIGRGACGTMWTPTAGPDVNLVYKWHDGSRPRNYLKNDYVTNCKIRAALDRTGKDARILPPSDPRVQCVDLQVGFCVPRSHSYVEDGATSVFAMERIWPVDPATREEVVKTCYGDGPLTTQLLQSDEANYCLMRVYLGRQSNARAERFVSMHNFSLHGDTLNAALGPQTHRRICIEMAEALAMLHWAAEVDGYGLELVLGATRIAHETAPQLWLLDFDLCQRMTADEHGIKQAIIAFYSNEPYFPQPGQDLWAFFKDVYMSFSARILDLKSQRGIVVYPSLPDLFIRSIELEQGFRELRTARLTTFGARIGYTGTSDPYAVRMGQFHPEEERKSLDCLLRHGAGPCPELVKRRLN